MAYPEIRFRPQKHPDGLKWFVGRCDGVVVGTVVHTGREWQWQCPGRAQPRVADDLDTAKQQLRTFWRTGRLP